MSLVQSLVAAVIVLIFIFVLVGGVHAESTTMIAAIGNNIAKVAISGAAVVALVALIIHSTSRR